jgi:arylsulfatase A-like enzyme
MRRKSSRIRGSIAFSSGSQISKPANYGVEAEKLRTFKRDYFASVSFVDAQVGKVVDELDRQGIRDNTIVFYIFGDNGSSAEGQNGSISELLAQNQIPNTIQQQFDALNKLGGLEALGGP